MFSKLKNFKLIFCIFWRCKLKLLLFALLKGSWHSVDVVKRSFSVCLILLNDVRFSFDWLECISLIWGCLLGQEKRRLFCWLMLSLTHFHSRVKLHKLFGHYARLQSLIIPKDYVIHAKLRKISHGDMQWWHINPGVANFFCSLWRWF